MIIKKILAYVRAKKEKRRRIKVAKFMKNHALDSYFYFIDRR